MNKVKDSYRDWSIIYDSNQNKTRDLDQKVTQEVLSKINFKSVLEIGCGTGKNTAWFIQNAETILAVDFSPEMLEIAKNKVKSKKVKFIEADITKSWSFNTSPVNLISINLVLEHIENIDPIFKNAKENLKKEGYLFICELHPFKQYLGSQAQFDNKLVPNYLHQISEYFRLAKKYNFTCVEILENFDDTPKINEENIPRLITFLFKSS